MAPHLKRNKTSHLDTLILYSGARTVHWELPAEGNSVLEIQTEPNPSQWKDVPVEKNYLIPPYHWHWYQTESFDIKKGRYIFTYEGKETVYDSTSDRITIPATARHTFRSDPTCTTECEVHITASPAGAGVGEVFFRNLYSYLEDCQAQNVEPSLPQLLLFLHSAEVSLALPGPAPIMRWLSWGMGLVIGKWVGGYLMGLKNSYGEYFDQERVRTS